MRYAQDPRDSLSGGEVDSAVVRTVESDDTYLLDVIQKHKNTQVTKQIR
jgi:hypothetical protein